MAFDFAYELPNDFTMKNFPFENDDVARVYRTYSGAQQERLLELRALILEVASELDEVSEVEECLKWGQPSFIAKPKGVGSTVRIDKNGEGVSAYFICNTNLVEQFRGQYPDKFNYIGNREIYFGASDKIDRDELKHCIAMALTYHKRKKRNEK